MPRRNRKARVRIKGQARKGRHKLDFTEVVALPDQAGDPVPFGTGAPRPTPSQDQAA